MNETSGSGVSFGRVEGSHFSEDQLVPDLVILIYPTGVEVNGHNRYIIGNQTEFLRTLATCLVSEHYKLPLFVTTQ